MKKNKPKLNKNITIEELNDWYWYKEEFIEFCRQYKLKTIGRKPELKTRIEYFIKTGNPPVENKQHKSKSKKSLQQLPKNINEPIPDNYTSSELFRTYFKSIIGDHFHFTAYMMAYIKTHPGITFKEYVDEWQREHQKRKNKSYKPDIMKSCEYNQYIRDFFANNTVYSLKDAIKCWKYKKSIAGSTKYSNDDLIILKDDK